MEIFLSRLGLLVVEIMSLCERDLDEIVSIFLLKTCRLCPKIRDYAAQAALLCALATTTQVSDDAEVHVIPLTTGSAAEFYIEPMLPHIGDIDIMHHNSTLLAIPRGLSPPTQLPAEFHNYVKVFEIIDSHLPTWLCVLKVTLLTDRM